LPHSRSITVIPMTDCNKKCWCKKIPSKENNVDNILLRIEKLESLVSTIGANFAIKQHVEDFVELNVKNIQERIDELEAKVDSFEEAVNDDNAYADGQVQERLSKIERCLGPLLANGNVISVEKKSPPKVPHKCPVCDGTGNDRGVMRGSPKYEFCMEYASCNSCEGQGIVWG
jgi:hypothetical protein